MADDDGGKADGTLAGIACRLARGACATQAVLDDAFARDLLAFARVAAAAGLPLDHPLVAAVAPSRMELREQSVDVAIDWSRERSVGFGVGLRLGGRVVHSFFEARYGTRQTRRDRKTLHVVAAAPPPPAGASPDPAGRPMHPFMNPEPPTRNSLPDRSVTDG